MRILFRNLIFISILVNANYINVENSVSGYVKGAQELKHSYILLNCFVQYLVAQFRKNEK